jgi:uncharacterized membrane protein
MSTPPGLGSGPSQDEKTHAMLAWFLSIVLPIIAPLIFFVISSDKPFAKRHAAMSLGLHLAASIVSVVLVITIVGALLVPLVYLAVLIFVIMGGLAANNGNNYDVPGIGPMIANIFKV